MNDVLEEKLKKLPARPGVYMMKDAAGTIIYVGKAKVLKNRVRQYFQNSKAHSAKTLALVSRIADLEYIICDSEMEALVLESNLIKENKPKYNIMLKDDKHYPYIKITLNERFPRIMYVRRIENDGAKYFGPYPSGYSIKETMALVKDIFMLPHCSRSFPRDIGKGRACLYYAMGKCAAPCIGKTDEKTYREQFSDIVYFLEGNDGEITKSLEEKMHAAAQNTEFELAAQLRDRIASVKNLREKQKVITENGGDTDVLAVAAADSLASAEVFYIRGGRLIGSDSFDLSDAVYTDETQLMNEFLQRFYSRENFIPATVLLSAPADDCTAMEEILSKKAGHRVYIKCPQRGDNKKTVDMARENALKNIDNYKTQLVKERLRQGSVTELAQILGLEIIPDRIESYDISHISGTDTVCGMVVFENGRSVKSEYRRFKIKTVEGVSDTDSLREALRRRLTHEKRVGDGHFEKLPDLILLDGGIAQLNAVNSLLEELGEDIPVFGMVKDDRHRTRGLVSKKGEVYVNPTGAVFRLITNIQDEVHRYSIDYHRKLRNRRIAQSELENIEGIGKGKTAALIKHFKSVNAIKKASAEDLCAVKGISRKNAEDIRNYFDTKKKL